MKDNAVIASVAIAGIVILESMALYKGIDGTMLTMVVAVVAGLGGLMLPQLKLRGSK